MAAHRDSAELRRTLGLFAITVYAVGDILGAGIYALVGRVAGQAGGGAWVSFLISALVAGLTGLTYAEWVSRAPVAAGAAAYSHRAFGRPFVAFLVGFLVLASGVTSAAAVSHAFVGYLATFVQVPRLVAAVGLLALLSGLNYRGIRESSRVNVVLTSVELSGLLLVIIAGLVFVSGRPDGALLPSLAPTGAGGILGGITLAFYAYVGFEDTVNVAQEVREPERNLPRAILVAIAFTTLVYLLVTVAALLTVPLDRLATSEAPLLEVLAAAGLRVPPEVFSLVALLAITNTGLLNLIMASRLLWGMSRDGLLPRVFLRIAPVRRTPSVAILAAFALAVLLAVSGTTSLLAQTTSLLLLLVFTTVHVGLIVVRRREPGPAGTFRTAGWTPWLGALTCAGLCLQYTAEVYLRAGLLLLLGVLAWVLMRPRSR